MKRLREVFEKYFENTNDIFSKYIFIDTETTGFGNSDRIIEIGAISVSYNGIEPIFDTFQTLIYPGDDYADLNPKITEVTKIASEDLKKPDVPNETIAYSNFINWLNKIGPANEIKFVAHNAVFDENKLRTNLSRNGFSFPYEKFTCTKIMANLVPSKDKKLNTVAEYFGFINEQQHRALTDTETCAYIFARMKLQNV